MNWYPGLVLATRPRNSVPGTTYGVGVGAGMKPAPNILVREPADDRPIKNNAEAHSQRLMYFFMANLCGS